MNEREVLRRLRAFHAGRPLPRGKTLHVRLAPERDLLVVAFVRMGGESMPWGVAWGKPTRRPTLRTVPEPRDRDLVASMMADFGKVLLAHLGTPGLGGPADGPGCLRQVWLPNATHLDMLHHLAYAYTFTRSGGADNDLLRALGRACGWLFREANRPGSQHVVVATEALRSAFTFPAEDVRQGHLGFLLAWLERGSRKDRMRRALAAERLPVATSLDPDLERSKLEPLVERWRDTRRKGGSATSRIAGDIDAVLAGELERRFELTVRAIGVLRADRRPENPGVAELVREALDHQEREHLRTERRLLGWEPGRPYVPSVETDRRPLAAARRYLDHEASEALRFSALVHHDRDLFEEAMADGEALEGTVESVWDEGAGRAMCPVWTVRARPVPQLKLRAGSRVCVLGAPKREGAIRDLAEDDGVLTVEIEITSGKRANLANGLRLPANDPALVGTHVALCVTSTHAIARRKIKKLWDGGPGAWLTHATPGGVLARVGPDDREPAPEEP